MSQLDEIHVLIRSEVNTIGFTQASRAAQTMDRNISSSMNSVGESLKKVGKIAAAALSIKVLKDFGQSCLEVGSQIAEVQNVVDQTFKTISSKADAFAETTIKTLGIGPAMSKQMIGTYGAMAKAFNIGEEQAFQMAKTITELNGDIASFYNISAQSAMTKTKSIFSGETESLKELGIVMTQSALDQYALANGWGKTTAKMTEQEKVLLRYEFILDRTKDVQGDFARNQSTWANQVRILSEQFNVLKGNLGVGFIQVLTPVIQKINEIIERLTVASSVFSNFMQAKFGIEIGGMGAVVQDVSSIGDAAEGAANSVGDIGDQAVSAAKQIGKLANFDQLNLISQNTSGSDAAPVTPASSLEIIPVIPESAGAEVESTLSTVFDKVKDFLPEFDFTNMIDSFERLKKAIEPITANIFDGLLWAYMNVLKPVSEWVINDAVPAFLNVLAGALTILNPLIEALKPIAQWFFDNFLKPIAEWTGGVIVDTLNKLADVLTDIGNWMSEHQEIITGCAIAVGGFFAAWKLTELMAFVQMSGGIITAIKSITGAIILGTAAKVLDKLETMYITALYAKDFVVSIAKGTVELIKQIAQFIIHKTVLVASKVAQLALTASTVAWNVVCAVASTVTWAFGAAIAFLTSPIGLVILAVAALVAGIVLLVKNWDTVKETAEKVWGSIVAKTEESVDKLKDKLKTVSTWFTTNIIDPIKSGFSSFWTFVSTGFSTLFNGLADVAKIPFNKIIDLMNTVIGGLNNIKIDIPDWVPGVGGSTFGTNINKIPKLKDGGVVDRETLAIFGEAGKEAVLPLENSNVYDQIGLSVANALVRVQKDSGSGNAQTSDLTVEIDGQTLAKAIVPYIKKEQIRLGI